MRNDKPNDGGIRTMGLQTRPARLENPVSIVGLLSLTLCLFTAGILPHVQAHEPSDGERQVSPMLLPKMREFVEQIRVDVVHGDKSGEVARIKKPLLRFSNPDRVHHHGSLWAWGPKGRPVAFYELFLSGEKTRYWIHAFSSTTTSATERITAVRRGRQVWTPPAAGIALGPFADSPRPATKPADRLQQMKAMAERFSAHEFWYPRNTRYELRLVAKPLPVYRYSDPESGLIDGAVFIFVHHNEPEVIVLIEAVQTDVDKLAWIFGLARMGSAKMHVMLDGREVWQVPNAYRNVGRPVDSYYLISERTRK
jgi:hypothetical protein